MRRFIRYLYEYEQGRRSRNVGFVKVEQDDGECAVHVHGKGLHMGGERKLGLYLFYMDGDDCVCVPWGEADNVNPALNECVRYTKEGELAGIYDRIKGLMLETADGRRYAADWDDTPADLTRVRIQRPGWQEERMPAAVRQADNLQMDRMQQIEGQELDRTQGIVQQIEGQELNRMQGIVQQSAGQWIDEEQMPGMQLAGQWIDEEQVPGIQSSGQWIDEEQVPGMQSAGQDPGVWRSGECIEGTEPYMESDAEMAEDENVGIVPEAAELYMEPDTGVTDESEIGIVPETEEMPSELIAEPEEDDNFSAASMARSSAGSEAAPKRNPANAGRWPKMRPQPPMPAWRLPGIRPGNRPVHRPVGPPGQIPGKPSGAGQGNRPGQAPGKPPGAGPGNRPNQAPGRPSGVGSGNRPGQAPGKPPDQKPGNGPGQAPGKPPQTVPGRPPIIQPRAEQSKSEETRGWSAEAEPADIRETRGWPAEAEQTDSRETRGWPAETEQVDFRETRGWPAEAEQTDCRESCGWRPGAEQSVGRNGRQWRVKKIQRAEISKLARCEWKLANNNFLLHGYYNYHHLIFLEKGGELLLGVPGIYHEREAAAAEGFGFSRFIVAAELDVTLTPDEYEAGEQFGYWVRRVRRAGRPGQELF